MSTFEVKHYRKKLDTLQTPTAMTATSTPTAPSGSCGGEGVSVHHEKNQPLPEEKMAESSLPPTATTDTSPLVRYLRLPALTASLLPPSPVAELLPAHLAALIHAAQAGQLLGGAVKLSSGLVTDLTGYVLAWAECWPSDRAHVLKRLEEAYAAVSL